MSRFLSIALIGIITAVILAVGTAQAAGNIDAVNRYAYGDLVGWIDFNPSGGGVTVTNTNLTGYAYGDLVGWIRMDPSGGGVTNDGSGNLGGYAYGELTGWISFDPSTPERVTIDASGNFSGYAYGDLTGWINFNCGSCAVPYKVQTSWRPNQPPTAPTSITYSAPATAYTNLTLTCQASGATDPDSGPSPITYKYQFRDAGGVLQVWSTTNTFNCQTPGCDAGDTISCQAKANDGAADGPEGTPATKTISANLAPTIDSIGNKSVNEAATLTFTVYAVDEEGSLGNVTITKTGNGAVGGTTWDGGLGKWKADYTWQPTYTQAGSHNVTFRATDGQGAFSEQTITITVNNVNRAPTIDNITDVINITEGQQAIFDVIVRDRDSDDTEAVSYTITPTPNSTISFTPGNYSYPTCTLVASGDPIEENDLKCVIPFSWTPNYLDEGTYTLTFIAKDLQTAFATEPVTIVVSNVNNPNTSLDISGGGTQNVDENVAMSFTLTGIDEDTDDTLTFTWDDIPAGGVFPVDGIGYDSSDSPPCSIVGGPKLQCEVSFNWTPSYCQANPGDNPTFKDYVPNFTVSDGLGGNASANKIIQVRDKNRAVTFTSPATSGNTATFTVDEMQNLSFSATAADLDVSQCADNTHTYTCEAGKPGANFACQPDGQVSFTPDYTQAGVYTFAMTVADGMTGPGSSDAITIEITVADVNQAPFFDPDPEPQAVVENVELSVMLFAKDNDGDVLTITKTAGNGTVGATVPSGLKYQAPYTWTPLYTDGGYPQQFRDYTVNFQVADDGSTPPALTDATAMSVRVYDKNRQPTIDIISAQSILENTLLSFQVVTGDADNFDNTLTHSITTPNGNHPGATILDPTKPPPTYTPITINWTPAYTFVTDIDNLPSKPTTMTIQVADGSAQPQTTSGGGIATTSQQVGGGPNGITVYDVNRAPAFNPTPTNRACTENQPCTFTIIADDMDGDSTTSVMQMQDLSPLPTGISYPFSTSATTGVYPKKTTFTFNWTPNFSQGGTSPTTCFIPYNISVSASDVILARARGAQSPEVCPATLGNNTPCAITSPITITVNNSNQTPVFDPISNGEVFENAPFTRTVHATDADTGDAVTYSITNVSPSYIDAGNQASIDGASGEFSWTPNFLQAGTIDQVPSTRQYYRVYTFTVQARDNFSQSCPLSSQGIATTTFTVKVKDANRPPSLSDTPGGPYTILEQATSSNSFNLVTTDTDTDNTFLYNYISASPLSPSPALPLVDTVTGITIGGSAAMPYSTPNKLPIFMWVPTINQAYYNDSGILQPYTFTFQVDDQRDCGPGCIATDAVNIKIVDQNRKARYSIPSASVVDQVGNPLTQVSVLYPDADHTTILGTAVNGADIKENTRITFNLEMRDDDYDYIRQKADQLDIYLVGYNLITREIPFDPIASYPPRAGELYVGANAIPSNQLTGTGSKDVMNSTHIAPGTSCTSDAYRIDLDTITPKNCFVETVGQTKNRLCIYAISLDTRSVNLYDNMGEHQLIFETQDRAGDFAQGGGNDPAYTEDNPLCPKHIVGIQLANVNRAPNAPLLDASATPPNDTGCVPLTLNGCTNHRLIDPDGELYNPANLVFTFTPKGDLDNWAHEDLIDYVLYIRKIGPSAQDPGFTRRSDVIIADVDSSDYTNRTFTVPNLDPRTDYEWYVRAEDDAPDGMLFSDSAHWRFRTATRECTNGYECRKGEVCYDDDSIGTTPNLCKNFNECSNLGAECYISACDPGKTSGDLSCAVPNPSNRVFEAATSRGKCASINSINQCDLPAAAPNTPQACDADGATNCQGSGGTGLDLNPVLKWLDSDPPENWNDYRGVPLPYPGNDVRHTFHIWNYALTFDRTFTDADTVDLDYQSAVNRFFAFNTSLGSPFFLEFDKQYFWTVTPETIAPDPNNPHPVSSTWNFTTKTVCDTLGYDYTPANYSQPPYNLSAPPRDGDPPVVLYPIDAVISWPPQQSLIDDGILVGGSASGAPLYDFILQECDSSGANCGVLVKEIDRSTYPSNTEPENTTIAFNGAAHPYLNFDKTYQWQAVVYHGAFTEEPVSCPMQIFKTPPAPTVTVAKTITSLLGGVITYRIDFAVQGEEWDKIKAFYILDTYPVIKQDCPLDTPTTCPDPGQMCTDGSFCTDFQDTTNADKTEEVWMVKNPTTLTYTTNFSDTDDSSWFQWNITNGANPEVPAGSSGSLAITLNEYAPGPGDLDFPECAFLTNRVEAGAQTINNQPVNIASDLESYLSGSEILDNSYITTGRGNIHSNADICFQNAPQTGYVTDYFATARGIISAPAASDATSISRVEDAVPPLTSETSTTPRYVRKSSGEVCYGKDPTTGACKTFDDAYDDFVTKLTSLPPTEYVSEQVPTCTVTSLFCQEVPDPCSYGPGNIVTIPLRGKVYHCKDDGSQTQGNLLIDKEMQFVNNGGAGTVIVDGTLTIADDLFYTSEVAQPINDLEQLASLGWIVKEEIGFQSYPITAVADCNAYPASKWCGEYNLVIDPDGAGGMPEQLTFGPLTVGPDHIVGMYFSAKPIRTGAIHLPLVVEGSFVADDVVFQRLDFPD